MTKKTPDLVHQALALYQQGHTTYQIADQISVSQPTVWRWINQAGQGRTRATPRSRVDTADIVRLRQSGMSWRRVAQAVGMSVSGTHSRYQKSTQQKGHRS